MKPIIELNPHKLPSRLFGIAIGSMVPFGEYEPDRTNFDWFIDIILKPKMHIAMIFLLQFSSAITDIRE